MPTINSAIDKTDYFKKYLLDKNPKCKNYNLNKIEYIHSHTNIILSCNNHGEFPIKPKNLINKKQGCPKCVGLKEVYKNNKGWSLEEWQELAEKSKNFDSFKFYILEFYNENERFYKIGRTFRKIDERYRGIPYKYKIIKIYNYNRASQVHWLEDMFIKLNQEYLYKPRLYFHGASTECFTKIIDILNNDKEIE